MHPLLLQIPSTLKKRVSLFSSDITRWKAGFFIVCHSVPTLLTPKLAVTGGESYWFKGTLREAGRPLGLYPVSVKQDFPFSSLIRNNCVTNTGSS